jgi:hypothetical protein
LLKLQPKTLEGFTKFGEISSTRLLVLYIEEIKADVEILETHLMPKPPCLIGRDA